MEYDLLVPIVSSNIETVSNNGEYNLLKNSVTSRFLKLNDNSLRLFELADGENNLLTITQIFNKEKSTNASVDEVHNFFYQKLDKFGGLKSSVISEHKGDQYVHFKKVLISESNVRLLCPPFSFLFDLKFFTFSFLFLVLFTIYISIVGFSSVTFSSFDISLLIPFFLLLLFLHEMGHAAACYKNGALPGKIGLGFYLYYIPVFYTEVTDAWRLSKKKRIAIDLAGVYMELWVVFVLSVIYYFYGIPSLLGLLFMVIWHIIKNLNPLLRYDGYWVVSDYFGIPNLRRNSFQKTKQFILNLLKGNFTFDSKRDLILVVYGLSSWVFIIAFMSFLLFFNTDAITSFPVVILKIINSIPSSFHAEIASIQFDEFLIGAIFYFVSFRLIYSIFIRKFMFKLFKNPKSHA